MPPNTKCYQEFSRLGSQHCVLPYAGPPTRSVRRARRGLHAPCNTTGYSPNGVVSVSAAHTPPLPKSVPADRGASHQTRRGQAVLPKRPKESPGIPFYFLCRGFPTFYHYLVLITKTMHACALRMRLRLRERLPAYICMGSTWIQCYPRATSSDDG